MTLSDRIRRLLLKKHSYRDCLQNPDGETLTKAGATVMKDLARFCGAFKSSLPTVMGRGVDPIAMAYAEGRRSVYLRIAAQLNVKEADILSAIEEDA